MHIVGVDHVQITIPAGEEAAARAFYGALLGLPEIPKPPALAERGGCWFAAPNLALHLSADPGFAPASKAHPAFQVADLDACARALFAAGVQLIPDNSVPHVRRFYAADPFGNRLELLQAGDEFGEPSQLGERTRAT